MWKTLVDFSAQISRFKHILPLSTAQINCSGTDLPLFRKPYVFGVKMGRGMIVVKHGNDDTEEACELW
jgi:hypothetical protein